MRNSLILDPYFTISPTVPSAARQLRSQPQPRLQRQRSLRDLSTTLLRLREAASDHAGIQGLPRRASRPSCRPRGDQANTLTTWPTEARHEPCCCRCCSMPCSRLGSDVPALEVDATFEALTDTGLAVEPEGLVLVPTPRSVINLLNVVFRLLTLALVEALDVPLEALALLFWFRVLISDSSLLVMPPWP